MSADKKPVRCNDIKSEFSRLKDVCYLDHVGAGLYADSQIDAIFDDLKRNIYGNPHSTSVKSKYCKDAVDHIRFRILDHFCTNSGEYSVIFTSGATESLKSIAEWFCWNNADNAEHKGSFVYTQDNHTSVLGLREIVTQQHNNVYCIKHEEVFREFKKTSSNKETKEYCCNSLFVYSAQCNFSGCKYPLSWIEKVHDNVLDEFVSKKRNKICPSRWFTLLDAASYVPTNQLDLSHYKPDFVAISFYKMFGYPTGLGALLVKISSECVLNKKYYGGGTVLIALSDDRFHRHRPILHERCEDGTINYLSILSLRYGFDTLQRLGGTMEKISQKIFFLVLHLHEKMLRLHHSNGNPAVVVYRDTDYNNIETQGGIVNFNLLRSNGEYVGYVEVLNIANLYGIQLRTGCFCNPGACQRHLKLMNEHMMKNFQKGHICGDNIDLIDGYPTGSIRVSFGYMSEIEDAEKLINMIKECFVSLPALSKIPISWPEEAFMLRKKFECSDVDKNFLPKNDYNSNENYRNNTDVFHEKETSILHSVNDQNNNVKMELSNIFVYPIKSCGAFNVTYDWPVCPTGLKYDREWMIISAEGVALTQKQIPEMCLILPHIDLDERIMSLECVIKNAKRTINISLDNGVDTKIRTLTVCESKVCNDKVSVIDCGDAVAHWLEVTLNKSGIRLVKLMNRNKSKKDVQLSLVNEAQYLLITESSVKWLFDQTLEASNWKLEDKIKAFRSNLVVSGNIEPLDELNWKEIFVGSLHFKVVGVCSRCQMICINQSSGIKNKEPLITLSKALKGKINFGIYLCLTEFDTSTLKVGDLISKCEL